MYIDVKGFREQCDMSILLALYKFTFYFTHNLDIETFI